MRARRAAKLCILQLLSVSKLVVYLGCKIIANAVVKEVVSSFAAENHILRRCLEEMEGRKKRSVDFLSIRQFRLRSSGGKVAGLP